MLQEPLTQACAVKVYEVPLAPTVTVWLVPPVPTWVPLAKTRYSPIAPPAVEVARTVTRTCRSAPVATASVTSAASGLVVKDADPLAAESPT